MLRVLKGSPKKELQWTIGKPQPKLAVYTAEAAAQTVGAPPCAGTPPDDWRASAVGLGFRVYRV